MPQADFSGAVVVAGFRVWAGHRLSGSWTERTVHSVRVGTACRVQAVGFAIPGGKHRDARQGTKRLRRRAVTKP